MKEKKRQRGMATGSVMLLMIFGVLCLTVFSVLSLVTAVSEERTAEKFAESVRMYYDADAEAVKIKKALGEALSAEGSHAFSTGLSSTTEGTGADIASIREKYSITQETAGGECYYYFKVPLKDNINCISVRLLYDGETLKTLSWEKQEISEWTPDTSIELAEIS